MMLRGVKKIVRGQKTQDGAGVHLVRVISRPDVVDFDPFLMLDAFDSYNPEDYIKGFPWHPHRGIETVTYLIQGDIEHGDSLGNKGSILDGGCQWMTAGGGILHQEMPQACEHMLGVQLWLNLPAKDKMTRPQYRDIVSDHVPKVVKDGSTVGVISGEYDGVSGAVHGDYVKMTFLDVELEKNVEFDLVTNPEDNLFIYTVYGSGLVNENTVDAKSGVLFEAGDHFKLTALEDGLRFLLFAGKPLKEPIAWGGPIVMNTREELNQAFQDLEDGNFIRKDVIL
ncbi:MAG: pirin family protein [Bacillota bacterium]|nr:pirin family protein [Bacillota bacterium]